MEIAPQSKGLHNDSLLIFTSKLFLSLGRIITTVLVAHHLNETMMGKYQNFWVQFNTLFAFSGLGLASFFLTFNAEKLVRFTKKLNTKNLFLISGILIIVAIIFALLQSQVEISFIGAFLFLIFNTLGIIIDNLFVIFKKLKPLLIVNGIYFLIFIGLHFAAINITPFNFNALILGLSVLSLLKIAVAYRLLAQYFKNPNIEIINTEAFEKTKRFWFHLYLFDAFQIFLSFSDKFIVSLVVKEDVSALYQNGTYVTPFLGIIFSAVSSAAFIQFGASKGNLEKERQILKNSGKILSLVVFPLFFILMFFSKEFINVVFSEKYVDAVPIFRMSLLTMLLYNFNYIALLQKHQMGKVINKGVIIELLSIGLLIYPMVNQFGLKGIPLTMFLSAVVQSVFYIIHHVKIFKSALHTFMPIKDWIIRATYFGLISFSLYYIFKDNIVLNDFWKLAISLSVVASIAIFVLFKEIKHSKVV